MGRLKFFIAPPLLLVLPYSMALIPTFVIMLKMHSQTTLRLSLNSPHTSPSWINSCFEAVQIGDGYEPRDAFEYRFECDDDDDVSEYIEEYPYQEWEYNACHFKGRHTVGVGHFIASFTLSSWTPITFHINFFFFPFTSPVMGSVPPAKMGQSPQTKHYLPKQQTPPQLVECKLRVNVWTEDRWTRDDDDIKLSSS
ncbi:uncharacterized protein EI90DRAFT_3015898 [Cantharellus anzutake]|uniref:uncharacterized protein n=1 Tax=Cantharellus anzutake TaxID=1750568 RepID=UPI001907B3B6|nr:uncharacterized protein EI90DRAFT_3015898 [Cantharellus anzutake]KAF8332287.1 hypothetical protein EI90DRAFT_3015898 [Cantharellus anzutake]